MPAVDLLDTNVLLYAIDGGAPLAKRERAQSLVAEALETGNAIVSSQVVQEAVSTATRKFKTTVSFELADALLQDVWLPLMKVLPSADLYRRALTLHQRHQVSFYDALIVAAAQEYGCARVLTEDLQNGQVFDGVTIVNPFV